MAISRGRLSFADGDIMGVDDFVSLEAQSIRTVRTRAELTTIFGASPAAGIAWISDTYELVGWDSVSSQWKTITGSFLHDVVLTRIEGVSQGAVVSHLDNHYWHDTAVTTRVTARNIALTGAQTGAANPFGLEPSGIVEVFDTQTGGAAVWLQEYRRSRGYTVPVVPVADADVEFLVVAAGGNGAPGRNAYWAGHPHEKSVMLSGGGGGGGEIRSLRLRVYAGQPINLFGLAMADGGGIQIRSSNGILVAAQPGAPSVRAVPQSLFFTADRGIMPPPVIPVATAPNAGASQWSQVNRKLDSFTGTTPNSPHFWMAGRTVPGGVTDGSIDNRYYPGVFGHGGGKSAQPYWWAPQGFNNSDLVNPYPNVTAQPWANRTFETNLVGGAGGGGSMAGPGADAILKAIDGKEGAYAAGGSATSLDTRLWPSKYASLAPGGVGHADRQIDTIAGTTGHFDKANVQVKPGAGGNGGVGEGAIRSILSFPADGGVRGLVMVRWSPAGRPLWQ